MDHHCLWQVELLQLPQKVHPLLSSFGEGADVQLPLEVESNCNQWYECLCACVCKPCLLGALVVANMGQKCAVHVRSHHDRHNMYVEMLT